MGNWGGEATLWRLEGVKDGQVVSSITCGPSTQLRLELIPSHTQLREGASYDMASVRIRVLDAYGNVAPYAQLALKLQLEGDAQLVGPDVVSAEGGMTGTFVKTAGKTGSAKLTVISSQTEPVSVAFTIG